jgi:NADPH-dependent 2,4-dienoyl-CoA reductase/sulfur reductase-like enzyme/nitrite reductase/ring-hydroxylating ferredoxin subunit
MSASDEEPQSGPDLAAGIPASSIADGAMLLGHVDDEPVLVARTGGSLYAIGATCSHYGGPLAHGLLVGTTVRCPWHHACFSLKTGEPLRAPALDSVSCFRVEESGGTVFVRERTTPPSEYLRPLASPPTSIVIIGAGAAGVAAAEMLRRCGYKDSIRIFDQLHSSPVDRPNLSKDYLAGHAEEAWVNMRPDDFFESHDIELIKGRKIARIDTASRHVVTETGSIVKFSALLLATGSTPVKLPVPGAEFPHVHYLRTLDDSRAIIAAAEKGKRAVVIGASFIGLEAAASLRARNIAVTVVAPDTLPLERVLGAELGQMVKAKHDSEGVVFHLSTGVTSISADSVNLTDGTSLPADFVVVGVGVRPEVQLAKDAGLNVDNGVTVNATLETSSPGIFAAGDIASWPDPRTGRIRVEHWVVAQLQGQTAARNMLGASEPFTLAPFFWSRHFDLAIDYVGHSSGSDKRIVDGDPMQHNCTVRYAAASGVTTAQADVHRAHSNLIAEAQMNGEVDTRV